MRPPPEQVREALDVLHAAGCVWPDECASLPEDERCDCCNARNTLRSALAAKEADIERAWDEAAQERKRARDWESAHDARKAERDEARAALAAAENRGFRAAVDAVAELRDRAGDGDAQAEGIVADGVRGVRDFLRAEADRREGKA